MRADWAVYIRICTRQVRSGRERGTDEHGRRGVNPSLLAMEDRGGTEPGTNGRIGGMGKKRRSYLDLQGAQISGRPEGAAHSSEGSAPSIALPEQSEVFHFAIGAAPGLLHSAAPP